MSNLTLEVLQLLEAVGAAEAKRAVPRELALVALRVREDGEEGVEVGLVGQVHDGERVQQAPAPQRQLQVQVHPAHPAVVHAGAVGSPLKWTQITFNCFRDV